MTLFNHRTFTYGYELELSNVSRHLGIPEQFGRWEHSERDIVNTAGVVRGVAADPLGVSPPFGGEINTVPTLGWPAQGRLIMDLLEWIRAQGGTPAVGPTAHGHIHVHVPGLTEDIDALHRLARYVSLNQHAMKNICGRFERPDDMPADAARYFEHDGGRMMPEWLAENLQKATDFQDFIRIHCCGKDGVSRGRPFRYAINMYCLKHTQTVEFRMFRGTLDEGALLCSFAAVEAFMGAALNGGRNFEELRYIHDDYPILPSHFAPMQWDRELWNGLQATKHPESRGKKERRYVEVTRGEG